MKRYLVVFATLFAVSAAFAQHQHEPCITDHITTDYLKNNPAAQQLKEQFYTQYEQYLQNPANTSRKSGTKRIIPVVFHVIHMYGDENISKAQIEDQIRVLNEDFSYMNADKSNIRSQFLDDAADAQIEFRLATVDPSGNCTDGITRTYSTLTVETRDEIKSLIRWDNRKYLNIWVVKSIRSQNGDQGTTLGFAYLPWSLPNTNNVDGIVIRADYVGTVGTSSPAKAGRTLTHEVGHYLGLLHPFENGCGSNCSSSGDRVCDTPPVASPSFGCNKTANTCSNDSPNEVDQIENFMDYADGNCQNMFTWGQKTIMDLVLSNANYRQTLVSSANLIATGTDVIKTPLCKPVADFNSVARVVCAGNSIILNDVSWGGKAASRTWTITGGTPSSSGDSAVSVTFNNAGNYNVTLQVTNSAGQSSITRQNIVVVMPATATTKAPTIEGFEAATFPPTGWTNSSNVTAKWERTAVGSATGSASTRVLINSSTATDNVYTLTLPAVDLNTSTTATLDFKVAYAQRTGVTSDRLRILYSTDCGNTWSFLSQRTGSTLASTSTNYNGTSYVPASAAEWRLISLPLSSISAGMRKNVIFSFEAYSNGGNNIYLDDINIGGAVTSVETFTKEELGMSVQPNPSSQSTTLSFTLPNPSTVDMKVYDITGKLVYDFGSSKLEAGFQHYQINKLDNNLTNGIYFVKLLVNNTLYTEKLVFVQ